MTDNDLRIGVIGYGCRRGLVRIAHDPHDGSVVSALADPGDGALADFRTDIGADVFTCSDYRELLSRPDLDAIMVCSPDYLHEEHAINALKAGKAVYLEKPMAITIAGCDNILRTARETGSRLFLGHNMRYMDFVHKMKEIIDRGDIGEVKTAWVRHFINYGGDAYFKDWHAERKYSNSLLLQKGAHDIDIIHWLCGGYTDRVTAMGSLSVYDKCSRRSDDEAPDVSWHDSNWPPLTQQNLNPVIDVEDLNMVLMELDNGIQCSYEQCHFSPDGWRNYTIIGTEGRVENFNDYGGTAVIRVWNKRESYNENGHREYRIEPGGEDHGGADRVIIEEFSRFVREGGVTAASPIAARNAVAAAFQATASLRNGSQPEVVPSLPEDIVEYFNANQPVKEL